MEHNGTCREKKLLFTLIALYPSETCILHVLDDNVFTSVFARRACTFCTIDSLLFLDP